MGKHGQTIQAEIDGQTVWIKYAPEPKKRIWHDLQGVAVKLLREPLLTPTVLENASENLRQQAHRLKRAEAAGICAPRVLELHDDHMITTHLGDTLYRHPDRRVLLPLAATALAELHAKGLAHGRPYLRDMTWDGERVGFLDFEEDTAAVMSFGAAQARDVWLFLSSAADVFLNDGEKAVSELQKIFSIYAEKAPKGFERDLKRLVRMVKPLRLLLRKTVWNQRRIIGKDVLRAGMANEALENII
jgi:tRNA A-37 threonylcarbamoyl transferase component Bud32